MSSSDWSSDVCSSDLTYQRLGWKRKQPQSPPSRGRHPAPARTRKLSRPCPQQPASLVPSSAFLSFYRLCAPVLFLFFFRDFLLVPQRAVLPLSDWQAPCTARALSDSRNSSVSQSWYGAGGGWKLTEGVK